MNELMKINICIIWSANWNKSKGLLDLSPFGDLKAQIYKFNVLRKVFAKPGEEADYNVGFIFLRGGKKIP